MTNIDPRTKGFNYGAPVPEPKLYFYHYAKAVADIARKRNSNSARQKSWDLDEAIRLVRLSCSIEEQNRKLQLLRKFILSEYAPRVTVKQYRKALAAALIALAPEGTY